MNTIGTKGLIVIGILVLLALAVATFFLYAPFRHGLTGLWNDFVHRDEDPELKPVNLAEHVSMVEKAG